MAQSSSVSDFIDDISPFFAGKQITYVDVGASNGETFAEFADRRIRIDEALLFEPRPTSYASLMECIKSVKRVRNIRPYQIALADEPGERFLAGSATMPKLAAASSADGSTNSSVTVATLDSFRDEITDRHIDVLKIDVAGHELSVLSGARSFLSDQSINVIYIAASMDPNAIQKTNFHSIDSFLTDYGYRVFRFYEQKHEWRSDSPFMRRFNVAYFSQKFADHSPMTLVLKLQELTDRLSAVSKEANEKEQTLRKTLEEKELAEQRLSTRLTALEGSENEWKAKFESSENEWKAKLESHDRAWNAKISAITAREAALSRHALEIDSVRQKFTSGQAELGANQTELAACQTELAASREAHTELVHAVAAMKRSVSWRITAPLRRISSIFPIVPRIARGVYRRLRPTARQ